MSLWQQNYDPAGNIWLSSLIASLPILFFFFALIKLKLKGYLVATYTVAIALLVVWFTSDQRESRRHDRQADRDGDAELRAYNERLAAMHRRDSETPDAR